LTDVARLKEAVQSPAIDMKIIEDDVMSVAAMDRAHAQHAESVIKKTINMLEHDILTELAKSYNADNEKMNKLKVAFTGCESDRAGAMTKVKELENEFSTKTTELDACKKHEKYLYDTLEEANATLDASVIDMKTKCFKFNEIVQEAQGIPDKCANQGAVFVPHNYGNMEMFADYTKRYKEWLEKCETAKKVEKSNREFRDEVQSDLKKKWRACREQQSEDDE